ncbi:DNA-formamidopyrimidine glycosylase family protein [Bacteroidota bacterium]
MLELPEISIISRQMKQILPEKEIATLEFRRVPKLEEWGMITQQEDEFREKLVGARIIGIETNPWFVYLELDNLFFLAIGELDGKVVFQEEGDMPSGKLNSRLFFSDGSTLTVFVKLWGVLKIFDKDQMNDHHTYYLDMSLSPLSESFTADDMIRFVKEHEEAAKLNAKKFITTKIYVNGLGNGFLQEILYRAEIHPRTKMRDLKEGELMKFHKMIRDVTVEGIENSGRANQFDLYNNPGRFISSVNKDTVGTNCLKCGATIDKISFEGGTCYLCPGCQVVK